MTPKGSRMNDTPTDDEREALEAARKWTQSSGPGVRVLRVLLAMAERAVDSRPQVDPPDAQVRAAWDSLGSNATVHLDFEDLRAALRAAWDAR